MNYDTARTFSVISMIFIVVQLVVQIFAVGTFACFIFGIGGNSGDVVAFLIIIGVMLVVMMLPSVGLYLAQNLHAKIKARRLTDKDRPKVLVLAILCLLGAGGLVPAILYFILFASWEDILHSPPPMLPPMMTPFAPGAYGQPAMGGLGYPAQPGANGQPPPGFYPMGSAPPPAFGPGFQDMNRKRPPPGR